MENSEHDRLLPMLMELAQAPEFTIATIYRERIRADSIHGCVLHASPDFTALFAIWDDGAELDGISVVRTKDITKVLLGRPGMAFRQKKVPRLKSDCCGPYSKLNFEDIMQQVQDMPAELLPVCVHREECDEEHMEVFVAVRSLGSCVVGEAIDTAGRPDGLVGVALYDITRIDFDDGYSRQVRDMWKGQSAPAKP